MWSVALNCGEKFPVGLPENQSDLATPPLPGGGDYERLSSPISRIAPATSRSSRKMRTHRRPLRWLVGSACHSKLEPLVPLNGPPYISAASLAFHRAP